MSMDSILSSAEIKEEPELNLDNSECIFQKDDSKVIAPKVEVETDEVVTVSYQIIFPKHEVKEEPELHIDDEQELHQIDDDGTAGDDKITSGL
jgi:hypothetical protein